MPHPLVEPGPMVLLVAICKDYRAVEDILLGFVELGITGATVLEGRGMGQIIGEIPIFVGLRGLFPGSVSDSHVIISVMENGRAQKALSLVDRVAGPLTRAGTGIAFTVPIGTLDGLTPELG